jgi:hypothetical protein
MAEDPEALAQLARLLADERLRVARVEEARNAVDDRFDLMVEGLVAETAASDDVLDRDSAREFVEARLSYFGDLLGDDQRSRLSEAVRAKIEAW